MRDRKDEEEMSIAKTSDDPDVKHNRQPEAEGARFARWLLHKAVSERLLRGRGDTR
jgi:hypothetical protein